VILFPFDNEYITYSLNQSIKYITAMKTAKEIALQDIRNDEENIVPLSLITSSPKSIYIAPLEMIDIDKLLEQV